MIRSYTKYLQNQQLPVAFHKLAIKYVSNSSCSESISNNIRNILHASTKTFSHWNPKGFITYIGNVTGLKVEPSSF